MTNIDDHTPANRPTGELSVPECWARLRDQAFGRLAVVDAAGPTIYPVNAVVDGGTLLLRTAHGSKIDAIRQEPRVAFEVDGIDEARCVAWSVVIRGLAHEVVRGHEAAAARSVELTPWQAGDKPVDVRIVPEVISGREFLRRDPPQ